MSVHGSLARIRFDYRTNQCSITSLWQEGKEKQIPKFNSTRFHAGAFRFRLIRPALDPKLVTEPGISRYLAGTSSTQQNSCY